MWFCSGVRRGRFSGWLFTGYGVHGQFQGEYGDKGGMGYLCAIGAFMSLLDHVLRRNSWCYFANPVSSGHDGIGTGQSHQHKSYRRRRVAVPGNCGLSMWISDVLANSQIFPTIINPFPLFCILGRRLDRVVLFMVTSPVAV